MSIENRLESLEKQLKMLNQRIANLETQVQRGTVGRVESPTEAKDVVETAAAASKDVLDWAGQQTILPRIATLCFLLVIALILRTITDNHLVNVQIGSLMGMIYAAILIFTGWAKYAQKNALAPVFTLTGVFLLISVVVEIHNHFGSLPTTPAFLILLLAGIVTTLISGRFKVALPVWTGTLCMTAAGLALDFPTPWFHYLVVLLLFANIAAFLVASVPGCRALRWVFFFITLLTLPLWRQKLGSAFSAYALQPVFADSLPWFLPLLGVAATTFVVMALIEVLRSRDGRTSVFALLLPSVSVLWAFGGFQDYASAVFKDSVRVGIHGTLAGMGLMAVAFGLARLKDGLRAASAFIIAGVLLFDLALPLATHDPLYPLPLLSLLALALAFLSTKWKSGIVRVISYAIQTYLCMALGATVLRADPGPAFLLNIAIAACLAGLTAFHYRWARITPPPKTPFFTKFDRLDLSAVFLLLAFLMNAFILAREITYQILLLLPGEISNSFSPAQSVLINLAVIALIWLAARWKDAEIRNVAIGVTLLGGVKVFSDLVAYHGIPLVLSLFSFGVAAALESTVLSRWHQHKNPGQAS